MRLVIIAVIALMVLGGGGIGAYYYFGQQANASTGEEVKEGAEKKAEAKGGGHGEGGAVEYVKLDPLILPLVTNDGLNQVVSLVVAIEVMDAANKQAVTNLVPRLTDAFIQDMYGVISSEAMKDGVLQVGYLKERLNKISQKVLGGEIETNVLLQVVQQRPA